MKRLYQITNSLQPDTEEISGIEALAQVSRISLVEGSVIYPKTRFRIQSRIAKRQTLKRRTE